MNSELYTMASEPSSLLSRPGISPLSPLILPAMEIHSYSRYSLALGTASASLGQPQPDSANFYYVERLKHRQTQEVRAVSECSWLGHLRERFAHLRNGDPASNLLNGGLARGLSM